MQYFVERKVHELFISIMYCLVIDQSIFQSVEKNIFFLFEKQQPQVKFSLKRERER